ncbi:hypothetical protein F5Y09DRAFT_343049 [Xylaria sp. FL1042]|nr:hypothetical protein F5Y09DRAFT_343049 [Xylaria sp. FL1042]
MDRDRHESQIPKAWDSSSSSQARDEGLIGEINSAGIITHRGDSCDILDLVEHTSRHCKDSGSDPSDHRDDDDDDDDEEEDQGKGIFSDVESNGDSNSISTTLLRPSTSMDITATIVVSYSAISPQLTALPVTSMTSGSLDSFIRSQGPTSTSSARSHVSEDSPTGLGTVTGVVLGSVIGAVVAVLILLTIAWLAIRKSIARRRGSMHARSWNFWISKKNPRKRRNSDESTEYRKPELDATETGVGYNPGAPHEFYVPRTGHDDPAELGAIQSPVELMG